MREKHRSDSELISVTQNIHFQDVMISSSLEVTHYLNLFKKDAEILAETFAASLLKYCNVLDLFWLPKLSVNCFAVI